MNVKRTIAIILILSIIVVAVFALSGCNITNDGSEDELKGIYGVTTLCLLLPATNLPVR